MVFNVELYTDKAHEAMKVLFSNQKHLTHNLEQITEFVSKTVGLNPSNDQQAEVLKVVVRKGLLKLEQLGLIDKVWHRMYSSEKRWMDHESVVGSGYTSITNNENRVKTEKAKKAVAHRALNVYDLHRLNQAI